MRNRAYRRKTITAEEPGGCLFANEEDAGGRAEKKKMGERGTKRYPKNSKECKKVRKERKAKKNGPKERNYKKEKGEMEKDRRNRPRHILPNDNKQAAPNASGEEEHRETEMQGSETEDAEMNLSQETAPPPTTRTIKMATAKKTTKRKAKRLRDLNHREIKSKGGNDPVTGNCTTIPFLTGK